MRRPAAQPADAGPARLLVVDDEEIVLAALRELLRQQGYAVSTATDPVAALELLRQHSFAVVLTDQQMPRLTGLEFLAEVKKAQPDASRILITAVLNLNTVIDAINKAEIFRFVLKPWQRDELLQTIQNAVERHQALRRDQRLLEETLAQNQELARLLQQLRQQPGGREAK
jgi:DNA-binding NtrC family response regulator